MIVFTFQPTYDTRYGFSNQTEAHNSNVSENYNRVEAFFTSKVFQNQLHPSQDNPNDNPNVYKAGIYNQNGNQDYHKSDGHKRQASNVHGHFTPSKSHNMNINEGSPVRGSKEGMYAGVPDLPPRVDRTAKPASLSKATSNRTAHERLFGTKAPTEASEPTNQNQTENFVNNKLGSLDRHQNSKSVSFIFRSVFVFVFRKFSRGFLGLFVQLRFV